jgi:hypothetical protein
MGTTGLRRLRRSRPRVERLEDRTLLSGGSTLATAPPLSFTAFQTAETSGFLATPNAIALYAVKLNAGDELNVGVSNAPGGGSLHGVLRVFRGDGTQLAFDAEPDGDPHLTFQAATTGKYFLGVSSEGNDSYDPAAAATDHGGATTGLFTLSLRRQTGAPAQPLLVARSFQLTTSTAAWGDTVSGSVTVENRGAAAAEPFTLSVRLSNTNRFDGSSDLILPATPALRLSGLPPGTAVTVPFTIVLPGAPGTPPAGFSEPETVFLGVTGDAAGVPVASDGPERGDGWNALAVVTRQEASGTNTSRAGADALALNAQVTGSLTAGGSAWYRVALTTDGQLTASLAPTGLAARLSLYDASGALLIQSDGQAPTERDPLIVQHLSGVAGGTIYYLEVEARAGGPEKGTGPLDAGVPSPFPGGGRYALTTGFTAAVRPSVSLSVDAQATGIVTGDFTGAGIPDLAVAGFTLNVFLGLGDGTFQPAQTLDYGHVPNFLAVGDFTGTGIPDLAILNQDSDTLSILLGDGDGTFHLLKDYPVGPDALGVVTGDFANNGKTDIAVADGTLNQVWVFLGNGDGTFQQPQKYDVGGGPADLVAGDFNGDGTLDLATANQDTNDISVLLGKGDGTFRKQIRSPTSDPSGNQGQYPVALVAGYFHGLDQPLDLATADVQSDDVTILTGSGDGTFRATDYLTAGSSPYAIQAADVNDDGRPDLVVANRDDSTLGVFDGQGDGTFVSGGTVSTGAGPVDLVIADFNGDDRPDLAAADQTDEDVAIRLGQGAGLFASLLPPPTVGEGDVFQAVTGDFNGDGLADLATANRDFGTVSVLLGNGDGTFHTTGQFVAGDYPTAIVAGDFNGDGALDLITNGGNQTVDFLRGLGNGTFAPPVTTGLSLTPSALVAGAFTGDGLLDLAVADAGAGAVEVLANNGDGTFQELTSIAVPGYPIALAAGDFTGNGRLDLAVACENSNTVTILINQGDGTFQLGNTYAVGSQPVAVIAADLRHKGVLDVVTANESDDTVSVLLGNGDGTFQPHVDYGVGTTPQMVVAADLGQHGILDLVTVNFGDNTISVLPGDGDGAFGANVDVAVGLAPVALAVGDFTRDGLPDIVSLNKGDTDGSLLLDQSDGTLAAARPFALGLHLRTLLSADLNNDGAPDLVRSSVRDSSVAVDLNNGDGFYQASTQAVGGLAHVALAAGDFNGDGRPDLAVANADSQDVTILLGYGNGGFQEEEQIPVGAVPTALAVGDFNGDGRPDLAVALSSPGEVLVLLGTGAGHFRPGGVYPVGTAPVALVAGDFFHDGKVDLAVADAGSNDVAVLHGHGDGTFDAALFYPVGAAPQALVAADLTGNGLLDLATADEDSNDVTVLLSRPGGTFRSAGRFAAGSGPTALAAGDFGGTSTPGLAVLNKLSGDLSFLVGRGDGTFTLGSTLSIGADPVGVVAADFNGDGHPDLALAGQDLASFYEEFGLGNGTFFAQGQVFAPVVATPLLGSVTGVADVTVLRRDGRILVRTVDPHQPGLLDAPQLVNPPTDPSDPTSGFPARDLALITLGGQPELAALDARDNGISFYAFDPTSRTFTRTAGPQVPGALPVSLAVGDLNGDGRDDLVVAALGSDQVFVYLQTATGTFGPTPSYTLTTGSAPSAVTLTDLTGDGRLDIVVANQFSADVSVFLNDPTAPFATAQRFRAGTGPFGLGSFITGAPATTVHARDNPVAVVAGAFDGSGQQDLLVLDRYNANAVLLPGAGPGGFDNPQPPLSLPAPGTRFSEPVTLVAAPFDSSGNLDLAVLDESTQQVLLFAGDGTGHFTPLPAVGAGSAPTGLSVADINGDGHLDLLVGDVSGDVLVLEGNGDGTFRPPLPFSGDQAALDVRDVGTGQPEALVANQHADQVTVQVRSADGASFIPVTALSAANPATQLAPGAVRWAGLDRMSPYVDAVVLGSGSNDVLVYRTTGIDAAGRPIFAPPETYFVGTHPASVTIQDINGDGIPDMLVANQASNDVSVLIGSWDGSGNWQGTVGPRLASGGVGPIAVSVRRLPGNANPDLVITNGQSGTITVLPGRGQGFFDDRTPTVLPISSTGVGTVSFGNGSSGVATTGDGRIVGFDLNDFAASLRTLFTPASGEGVAAVEELASGDVVAALDGGAVLDLRASAAGGLSVAGTFESLAGIPSNPSALEILETAAGPQALVTAAGQDRVFVFVLPSEALAGVEGTLEPIVPTAPAIELTAASEAGLTVVATLVADVLPGGEGVQPPPAAAAPALIGGGDEGTVGQDVAEARVEGGAGLDVEEKLRHLDLYRRTRDPDADGSSSRRLFVPPGGWEEFRGALGDVLAAALRLETGTQDLADRVPSAYRFAPCTEFVGGSETLSGMSELVWVGGPIPAAPDSGGEGNQPGIETGPAIDPRVEPLTQGYPLREVETQVCLALSVALFTGSDSGLRPSPSRSPRRRSAW